MKLRRQLPCGDSVRCRKATSPSPRPSPQGRGSSAAHHGNVRAACTQAPRLDVSEQRPFDHQHRYDLATAGRRFSLSLRERAGVRGKGPRGVAEVPVVRWVVRLVSAIVLAYTQAYAAERFPRTNLLCYVHTDGSIRPVKSTADWQKRRGQILAGMEKIMGPMPGKEKRVPLDVKTEEEVDCGDYVRRQMSYASEPGSRVPAYLLIPKTALENKKTKWPAVLALHQTHKAGQNVVVGLGESPNDEYGVELVRRGFVVLAPPYPMLANYQPDIRALGWQSGTLKGVWDNMRGLDLLASLPFVRTNRGFGAIGHSLGGHNSVFTAVFDERIKVVVSSCGLDSFLDYYRGDPTVWQPERGWCQLRYMPALTNYGGRLAEIPFDFHE